MKTLFLSSLGLLLMSVATISQASAAESYTRSSHMMQKQGKVHFQRQEQKEMSAQVQKQTSDVHPSDIEPAAGDVEQMDTEKQNQLSERMRLPRKN